MSLQIAWDCADPARMVAFWAPAPGYAVAPPPQGHDTWNDYYLSIGVPEDELDLAGDGADSIVDPGGAGPRIWFQQVPEGKQVKNRLHLDVLVGGGRAVPSTSAGGWCRPGLMSYWPRGPACSTCRTPTATTRRP